MSRPEGFSTAAFIPSVGEPMFFEVANRGTMYRLHRVEGRGYRFFLLESGYGNNYGEWIRLEGADIAWSYLAEKMPRMARLDGDIEGWVKVFAMAGIKVFNWEGGAHDERHG